MRRVLAACAMLASLAACQDNPAPTPTPTPTPPPVNRAPSFTSATVATGPESSTTAFYNAVATDPDNDPITYTLSGGADAALFQISSAGALSFRAGATFDAPADADADNVYQVTLTASDGRLGVSQNLAITLSPTVAQSTFYLTGRAGAPVRCVTRLTANRSVDRIFVLEDGKLMIGARAGYAMAPDTLLVDLSAQMAPNGILACATLFGSTGTFPSTINYVAVSFITQSGDLEVHAYAYRVENGVRLAPADVLASKRVLLRVPRAAATQNYGGGLRAAGSTLYIGVGDMGDPDAAQAAGSLAGKLIRMVGPVNGALGGPMTSTPEIWASGLRNPASLWISGGSSASIFIGDRGPDRQEVDMMAAATSGTNFGWPYFDGTLAVRTGAPSSVVPPVLEYENGTGPRQGQGVLLGGLIGSGRPTAELLFADRVTGQFWSVALSRLSLGRTLPSSQFVLRRSSFTVNRNTIDYPAGVAGEIGLPAMLYSYGSNSVAIVDADGDYFDQTWDD